MLSAIDVHSHFVPARFPKYVGRAAASRWPRMVCDCGKSILEIGGEKVRAIEAECWDDRLRVQAIARMGITCQAVSPMPELLSYWLDEQDAISLGQFINDEIETMCERQPGRLVGLGTVPLQNPERAARELEGLMRRACFRGVEIGTHVNGVPIGDARFAAFFGTAESLGAAVFVHAVHPIGNERLVGSPLLRSLVGYPCEMAFAICSLMTGGMLQRFQQLRICFSHGGGAFASVLPRLMHGWRSIPVLRESMPNSPRELAAAVYYDDLVYDPVMLRHLIEVFGESRLMIGTDFPFLIHDRAPTSWFDEMNLTQVQSRLLRYDNAARFLGLQADNAG